MERSFKNATRIKAFSGQAEQSLLIIDSHSTESLKKKYLSDKMKWSQMGGLRVEAEKRHLESGTYLHKYKKLLIMQNSKNC